RICRESFSVGNVPDVDLLEGYDSGCLHQRRVYLDASLIVEVGARDSRSMDLALEHSELHRLVSSRLRCWLCDSLDLNDGYCLSRELSSLSGRLFSFAIDRL